MMPACARSHPASRLFAGMEDSSIWSALSGEMGSVLCDRESDPRSAIATVGCFSFLAGEANEALLRSILPARGFRILVPKTGSDWGGLIEAVLTRARAVTRYAVRNPAAFDLANLRAAAEGLPDGYEMRPIDAHVYPLCLEQRWSACFVENFASCADYLTRARGIAVMQDGALVAGCSAFSVYPGGVEIEIATHPAHRRRGLAFSCAAAFLLSCLADGITPHWDAANPLSAALAEKLGYLPAQPYTAYEYIPETENEHEKPQPPRSRA